MVKKGKAKSASPFYAILGVIAVAGLAIIGYVASRPKVGATTVDPNAGPAVAEGYLLGKADAPVQVIEFADFECPACSQFATVTEPDIRKRLIEPGIIALRFYDFPLQQHPNTLDASNAAACAADQGKFWEMHDMIFETQDSWNGQATSRPKGVFKDLAKNIRLDVDKWEDCYDARRHLPRIMANQREGERRKVGQTPTFIIGDKMIPGALAYDKFKAYVDSALAQVQASAATKGGDTALKTAVKPTDTTAKSAR